MERIENIFSLCPDWPEQKIDWQRIESSPLSPYFQKMAKTPQQREWHGEGDVYTHTKLVCERLTALEGFWRIGDRQRRELFVAALLHDVGKPMTTRLEDGKLVSPKHGPVGAQIARRLLWTELGFYGTAEAQRMRETVCLLIRYHTAPPHALMRGNPELYLRKIASNGKLAPDFSIGMLCMLAEADVLGRVSDETRALCDMVRLCAAQAEESACLNAPFAFPDACTEHAYLSGRNVPPDIPLYDDTWGEVVMLCGLPGTGKDTFIREKLPALPMLSLDEIRREFGVKPTADQGRVIQEGKRRAKELLAARKPFVFNGTNVTDMLRANWTQLFEAYHARVRMVFLETGWQENLKRNAARREAVPERVIADLLDKLTPPEPKEAQNVEWVVL